MFSPKTMFRPKTMFSQKKQVLQKTTFSPKTMVSPRKFWLNKNFWVKISRTAIWLTGLNIENKLKYIYYSFSITKLQKNRIFLPESITLSSIT